MRIRRRATISYQGLAEKIVDAGRREGTATMTYHKPVAALSSLMAAFVAAWDFPGLLLKLVAGHKSRDWRSKATKVIADTCIIFCCLYSVRGDGALIDDARSVVGGRWSFKVVNSLLDTVRPFRSIVNLSFFVKFVVEIFIIIPNSALFWWEFTNEVAQCPTLINDLQYERKAVIASGGGIHDLVLRKTFVADLVLRYIWF